MSARRALLLAGALATLGVSQALPSGGHAANQARIVRAEKGERLADIAKRELGDAGAASELAAINGLDPAAPLKRRAKLRLPGPERDRANAAIRKARVALRGAEQAPRARAGTLIARALAARSGARYTEAEALAIQAEQELAGPVVRFSVVVEPRSGESRFVVQSGEVAVSAGDRTTTARAGQAVQAAKEKVRVLPKPPAAPSLLDPPDGGRVHRSTQELRWSGVSGARSYHVVVAKDLAFRERVASLPVAATALVVPPGLPKGVYYWKVSAVSPEGAEGPAGGPRTFEVTRKPRGNPNDWMWGPIWDPWGRPPKDLGY